MNGVIVRAVSLGGRVRLAGGASLPGVVVVVGERDEVHGVGERRRLLRGGPGRRAAGALLPQRLLVGRRARLAELVHQREDALHRRLHVVHAPSCGKGKHMRL